MTVQAALGWATVFMSLVVMTDIPATAQFAAAIAWLIFVAVLMQYGPKAFGNITTALTPVTKPAGSGGGGLGKQP